MGDITIPATGDFFQYNVRMGFETPPFGRESTAMSFLLFEPKEIFFYLQFYSNELGTTFENFIHKNRSNIHNTQINTSFWLPATNLLYFADPLSLPLF